MVSNVSGSLRFLKENRSCGHPGRIISIDVRVTNFDKKLEQRRGEFSIPSTDYNIICKR